MGEQSMRTPPWLFEFLNAEFGPFNLDAAASFENALCKIFYTGTACGLASQWAGNTFYNPPFRDVLSWVIKALHEARGGRSSLGILPVGATQAWYQHIAIFGTVYVPDRRIGFLMPDGTWPVNKKGGPQSADRDTIFLGMGGVHVNPSPREFRAVPLHIPAEVIEAEKAFIRQQFKTSRPAAVTARADRDQASEVM